MCDYVVSPCPPTDSIMRLMTVWRTTGKITRTTIIVTHNYIRQFLQF